MPRTGSNRPMLFKFLFTLYTLSALGLGGFLGYREWGGPAGIAGGLFMGLLLGTTLFYALGITLAYWPGDRPGDESDPEGPS